jgi:hypothetical protein
MVTAREKEDFASVFAVWAVGVCGVQGGGLSGGVARPACVDGGQALTVLRSTKRVCSTREVYKISSGR